MEHRSEGEQTAVIWLVAIATGFVLVLTLLPLVHTGHWVARVCDFPRVQIMGTSVALLALTVIHGAMNGWSAWHAALLAVLLGVAGWQLWLILPFSRIWRQECRPLADANSRLSVLIANLDYRNDRKAEVAETIRGVDPDILLLIEIDGAWDAALRGVADGYAHREGVVRGDGLGIVLLSRVPIEEAEVQHIVSDDRASVHVTLAGNGTAPIRLVALHPTPPGLKDSDGDRHDSRMRDAELLLLANAIEESDRKRWIVVGDLNDVAWSRTTQQFRRIGGLRDPRIGRALLNTFHARHKLMRYPLDHLFLSNVFGVSSLKRVRLPGSDHFGVLASIDLPRRADGESNQPEASGVTRSASGDDAEDIMDEGLEDARE